MLVTPSVAITVPSRSASRPSAVIVAAIAATIAARTGIMGVRSETSMPG